LIPNGTNQGNLLGPDINTIQISTDLHRAFHSILNLFLRSNKEFQGLGNFSSESAWTQWTNTRAGRELILTEIKAASTLIDKTCGFVAPNSLLYYVEKNEPIWLNDVP